MATSAESNNSTTRVLRPFAGLATLAAKPIGGMLNAAAGAGINLERRMVDSVLASSELERVLTATIDSVQVQAAFINALSSDAAKRIVDAAFDSGLIDRVVERLPTSKAVWDLIDEVAASPAVTAAISQQGLGFADQMGDEVRERSRKADDWAERTARRLTHRAPRPLSLRPDQPM
jgi:hypothetical protein